MDRFDQDANLQDSVEKVFCQSAGQEVSVTTCLTTQGREGCFGCASPHRLCESCRQQTVAVPAVGLCSLCLAKALIVEENTQLHTEKGLRVDCQLVKRPINASMCLATQGQEGCQNCPAPTRLCEQCGKHPVRYPRYGLCLACTVQEFNPEWEMIEIPEVEMDDAQTVQKNNADEKNTLQKKQKISSQEKITAIAKQLLPEAKRYILVHDQATVNILRQCFDINFKVAGEILRLLEAEGFIGPARKRAHREIYGTSAQLTDLSANHLLVSEEEKKAIAEKLIKIFGIGSRVAMALRSLIEEAQTAKTFKERLRNLLEEQK